MMNYHKVQFKHRDKDLFAQILVMSALHHLTYEDIVERAKKQLKADNEGLDLAKEFSHIYVIIPDGRRVLVETLEEPKNSSNEPVSEPVATSNYPFITLTFHDDPENTIDIQPRYIMTIVRSIERNCTIVRCYPNMRVDVVETVDEIKEKIMRVRQ